MYVAHSCFIAIARREVLVRKPKKCEIKAIDERRSLCCVPVIKLKKDIIYFSVSLAAKGARQDFAKSAICLSYY